MECYVHEAHQAKAKSISRRLFRASLFNPQEFKKSEMSKYSTSPSSPDTAKSKPMEWQVLYTTHLTQKAKKFHDGFLQIVLSGSQGRQIKLYDGTRQLLDSRFLKKDEVIKSGESLKFDGHLVNIEECEGDNKPPRDLNVQGRNHNIVGKTELVQNPAHTRTASPVEWDVMYTTQTTQKAKKYNCGILRVAPCGSYRMQATLVSEDGDALGHNFLKLSEDVRTGITLRLPNYLVEVGEQRKCSKGEQENSDCSWKSVDLDVKSTTLGTAKFGRKMKIHEDKPAHSVGKCQDASPRKNMSNTRSSMDCNGPSSGPTSIPIRAARDILSFIKKPMIPENIVTVESTSEKHGHSAQVLDSIHSDLKNPEEGPARNFNHKRDAVMHLDEETFKKSNHSNGTSQTKDDDKVPSGEIFNLVDSQNEAEDQATSSNFSLRNGEKMTGIQSFKKVKHENNPLHDADKKGINERCNEVSGVHMVAQDGYTAHGWFVLEEINSKQVMSTEKMEEFPSFDLGFLL